MRGDFQGCPTATPGEAVPALSLGICRFLLRTTEPARRTRRDFGCRLRSGHDTFLLQPNDLTPPPHPLPVTMRRNTDFSLCLFNLKERQPWQPTVKSQQIEKIHKRVQDPKHRKAKPPRPSTVFPTASPPTPPSSPAKTARNSRPWSPTSWPNTSPPPTPSRSSSNECP